MIVIALLIAIALLNALEKRHGLNPSLATRVDRWRVRFQKRTRQRSTLVARLGFKPCRFSSAFSSAIAINRAITIMISVATSHFWSLDRQSGRCASRAHARSGAAQVERRRCRSFAGVLRASVTDRAVLRSLFSPAAASSADAGRYAGVRDVMWSRAMTVPTTTPENAPK